LATNTHPYVALRPVTLLIQGRRPHGLYGQQGIPNVLYHDCWQLAGRLLWVTVTHLAEDNWPHNMNCSEAV